MFYYLTYPFFFTAFRLIARVLGRLRSSGECNVPLSGGFLYCPNHTTDADPPILLVTVPRRCWFIAKEEWYDVKILGWMLMHFHTFPIKRDSPDRAALRRAEGLLRAGEPLTLFAEGRCSENGKLLRLQPGAAMLAVRTGVPIIPVGIEHNDELVPYGMFSPRKTTHPVTVTFGPPIHPRDYAHLKHGQAIEAITKKLGEELARLTHQDPPPEEPAKARAARSASGQTPTEAEGTPSRAGLSR